jgi:hypothetical protein
LYVSLVCLVRVLLLASSACFACSLLLAYFFCLLLLLASYGERGYIRGYRVDNEREQIRHSVSRRNRFAIASINNIFAIARGVI